MNLCAHSFSPEALISFPSADYAADFLTLCLFYTHTPPIPLPLKRKKHLFLVPAEEGLTFILSRCRCALILFFSSLAASAGSIFFTSAEEALRFLELRFDSFVDVPAFLLALVLAFCTRAKEATIINQQSSIGHRQ
jgi:hypothetical protein